MSNSSLCWTMDGVKLLETYYRAKSSFEMFILSLYAHLAITSRIVTVVVMAQTAYE